MTKLRKLISTNEKIKKAEAEFRLSCKEELAVLEEQNTSSRQKLEEMAALDGRSPEGARRYSYRRSGIVAKWLDGGMY